LQWPSQSLDLRTQLKTCSFNWRGQSISADKGYQGSGKILYGGMSFPMCSPISLYIYFFKGSVSLYLQGEGAGVLKAWDPIILTPFFYIFFFIIHYSSVFVLFISYSLFCASLSRDPIIPDPRIYIVKLLLFVWSIETWPLEFWLETISIIVNCLYDYTVHSESIQTTWLFLHFVTLQPNSKMD
jgi:hypothetical protein